MPHSSFACTLENRAIGKFTPDVVHRLTLDELSRFDRELPWFKYVPTVSRPWDHEDWSGEIGRADDILRKYADHWELDASNTMAYLCGHPEMIEHSKAILKRRGFTDKGAVKEEVYWIPAHK